MEIIRNTEKKAKKQKLPRFMVAENPMAAEGEEYILHLREPRMLLRVVNATGISYDERDEFVKQLPVYGACEAIGNIYYIYPVEQYTNFFGEKRPKVSEDLAILMKRIADWWVAYVKFEDENYGNWEID